MGERCGLLHLHRDEQAARHAVLRADGRYNRRAWEHRNRVIKGFTHQYNCDMLVWFETFETRENATARERQIKNWKRDWKIELIEEANPDWRDLADTLL